MILVTGGSGFLGRHLLEALSQKGTPVKALYFRSKDLPDFPNVTWASCDLSDVISVGEQMQGIRQVYNCAATVSFDPKDSRRLVRDNVAVVTNVVNASLDAGVEKLVHVSSIAALGRGKGKKGKLINEADFFDEGKDNSRYALGKYLGEMEVWRGMAEGLKAAIVNPAIILGAGNWTKGSARLMKVCYDAFPWFTEGITAWVDVKDVVRALILLMESPVAGERFILSEGNYPYRDIFTQMALALKKPPPHRKAGRWMSELVWRWAFLKSRIKGTEATITRETARAAHRQYRYDHSKFLKAFPDFAFTPMEQTIQAMAETFLKEYSDINH